MQGPKAKNSLRSGCQFLRPAGLARTTPTNPRRRVDHSLPKANWHIRGAAAPFTRGDVLSNGEDRAEPLRGDDAWKPKRLFMFGLDTNSGRPNEVVTLRVDPPTGELGWLSTDVNKGEEAVPLPVV